MIGNLSRHLNMEPVYIWKFLRSGNHLIGYYRDNLVGTSCGRLKSGLIRPHYRFQAMVSQDSL